MDGGSVADFGLPVGTLIVSVTRDGDEIIPDGHTILRAGDELEILTREKDVDDVEDVIDSACRLLGE
jgi:Trk K+ transport system NAD-binding subunit